MASDNGRDSRSVDRKAAGAQPAGGQPAPPKKPGHTVIVTDLTLTPQEMTDAAKPTADAARQGVDKLNPVVQPEVQRPRTRKPRRGEKEMIRAMAALQKTYDKQLGHLNTDADRMNARVDVSDAADEQNTPIRAFSDQLIEVSNRSIQAGMKEALTVYRRALSVANAFPEIAAAIAPYRDAFKRVAMKGAATRRHRAKAKAKEEAATPPPPATPSTAGTPGTLNQK